MNGILISHDESGLSDDKCPRCNSPLRFEDNRDFAYRGHIKGQSFQCPVCGKVLELSLWYDVNIEIDLPRADWPDWRKEQS